jgi:low temperature requirement protein LtrA
LRRDEDFDVDREVTWLELFFDLVFVVVLSRLARDLAHDTHADGVVAFIVLFAAVFWAWNAFAYYIERFESDGLENRLFVFAAMAAVAALAVWTEDGLGSHYRGFAIAYVATRLVNMAQWIRAGWHVPIFRPVAARFVAGFVVAVALIAAAGQLDGGLHRLVFALAVVVEIATPIFTLPQQALLPRLSTSKFPERFGLFTILVLGESVVGVVNGLSELNTAGQLGTMQIVNGGLGLAVGIGMWWIYFDFIARRAPKPQIGTALGWVYLHLVTLAAITAVGASISVAIADSVETGLTEPVRHLIGGSASIALLGMAALEMTLQRRESEPTSARLSPGLKAAVAFAIGVVTWLDLGWNTTTLLATIIAGFAVPVVYGVSVWYSASSETSGV